MLASVLLGLFLLRAPLLRGLADLLVTEDPAPHAAHLVLFDGDDRHHHAAELYRTGAVCQILLLERVPERLETFGILLPAAEVDRRKLQACGVPNHAIQVLPGETDDDWDRARLLQAWLHDHPDARLLLLCKRFGSRRLRYILGGVHGGEEARVHLRALPDRDHDETNWWQHKDGLLDFFNSFMGLAHTRLAGESPAPRADWDPDTYERSLR